MKSRFTGEASESEIFSANFFIAVSVIFAGAGKTNFRESFSAIAKFWESPRSPIFPRISAV